MVHHHALRHVKVIQRLHGNGDVGNLPVDGFFRAGADPIAVHHAGEGIRPDRPEIGFPVRADELSQSCAAVDQIRLRPEIHQAVARRCSRQAEAVLHVRPDLPDRFPSLAVMVLEAAQLVQHQQVKGPGLFVFFKPPDQPADVFAVDDVNIGVLQERCFPLLRRSGHDGNVQEPGVLPVLPLRRPDGFGHPQRRDHQRLRHFEAVKHQIQNGGQSGYALAQAHLQDQHGLRMGLQELHAVGLVFM